MLLYVKRSLRDGFMDVSFRISILQDPGQKSFTAQPIYAQIPRRSYGSRVEADGLLINDVHISHRTDACAGLCR